jgi:hypothetical protein
MLIDSLNRFLLPSQYRKMFEIQETKHHGIAIVAKQRLEPGADGLIVFREEALLTVPNRGSERDQYGDPPAILDKFDPQIWTDWNFFLQQPDSTKEKVLKMYTAMKCKHALWLFDYLAEKDKIRQAENIPDEGYDGSILDNIDEFVQFTMVVRFNSVELCPPSEDGSGPGENYGHGLFEMACKLSHSCKPNCVWHTTLDGKAKEVRVIAPINDGDELTVDYIGSKLDPIPMRRETLMQSQGFLCECDRCAKQGDDTRRFKCINYENTKCPGVHFLHQPLSSDAPALLACTCCGEVGTQTYTDNVLEKESDLLKEIRQLEELADEGHRHEVAVVERINNLQPTHELHSLAERCYMIQGELYSQRGEYIPAAQAYAKQIECRLAILGDDYYNETTAFCLERLGDALKHVNIVEAEEAYKRSVRTLFMMRGDASDPYSNCALNKLREVQNQRVVHPSDELPHEDAVSGLAAPSIPDPVWMGASLGLCGRAS